MLRVLGSSGLIRWVTANFYWVVMMSQNLYIKSWRYNYKEHKIPYFYSRNFHLGEKNSIESKSSKFYNRVKWYEQMGWDLVIDSGTKRTGTFFIYYTSPVLRIPHRRMCKGIESRVRGERVMFSMAKIQCAH